MAKKLRGRNQHQVKNRFVSVMSKELSLKRSQSLEILLDENLMLFTRKIFESLKIQLRNLEISRNQYAEKADVELPSGFFLILLMFFNKINKRAR